MKGDVLPQIEGATSEGPQIQTKGPLGPLIASVRPWKCNTLGRRARRFHDNGLISSIPGIPCGTIISYSASRAGSKRRSESILCRIETSSVFHHLSPECPSGCPVLTYSMSVLVMGSHARPLCGTVNKSGTSLKLSFVLHLIIIKICRDDYYVNK